MGVRVAGHLQESGLPGRGAEPSPQRQAPSRLSLVRDGPGGDRRAADGGLRRDYGCRDGQDEGPVRPHGYPGRQ